MAKFDLQTFHIHAPYYINLASLNPRTSAFSIQIIREELKRGDALQAGYVMTHLGSAAGQSREEGISKVITGIKKILTGLVLEHTQFLIEISAGSGQVLGNTFTEIGEIVSAIKNLPGFGGICFDTCHAFASGYDYRTPAGTDRVLAEFDEKIGLQFLKLTHVNDSKMDLGMKRDRHEHIDKGFVKTAGLKSLLTTQAFLNIDWLLETPGGNDRLNDIAILKKIRSS